MRYNTAPLIGLLLFGELTALGHFLSESDKSAKSRRPAAYQTSKLRLVPKIDNRKCQDPDPNPKPLNSKAASNTASLQASCSTELQKCYEVLCGGATPPPM